MSFVKGGGRLYKTTLANSVENAQESFNGFSEQLDRLSDDINTLETFLTKSSINIPFQHEVSELITTLEELNCGGVFFPEWVDGCPITIERIYLRWDKYKDDKFRLLYQKSFHGGFMDLDSGGSKPYRVEVCPKEHERKPLIECKLDVRIAMAAELPVFIDKLACALRPLSSKASTSLSKQLEKLASVVDWQEA